MPLTTNAPERVTVTLPEEVKALFLWLKNYDHQFDSKDAAIAAFLMRKGAEAYYQQGLENINPLEEEVANAFAERTGPAMRAAIEEPETVAVKNRAAAGNGRRR